MMHTCSMCWFTKPFHPNIQYEYLILGANNSRSKNTASGGYSNVFIFPMYSGKNIATEHLYGWLSCDINARCVQNPLSLYFTGWSDKNSHIHNNPWYSMWIQYNAPIINQPSSINYKINEMNHHLLNDCIQLPSNTYYLFLPWPVSGLDCELPQTLYIYIHLYTFIYIYIHLYKSVVSSSYLDSPSIREKWAVLWSIFEVLGESRYFFYIFRFFRPYHGCLVVTNHKREILISLGHQNPYGGFFNMGVALHHPFTGRVSSINQRLRGSLMEPIPQNPLSGAS